MYKTFSFPNLNILDVENALTEDGVVVIEDIYTQNESQRLFTGILSEMSNICPDGIKGDVLWNDDFLPKQTRSGLFKNTFSNLHNVWEIRQNINIVNIYAKLYSLFRHTEYNENQLFVSGDAINIRSTTLPISNGKDWAHLDQRESNNLYKCIQGQVVLNNSSASFVCSPKSHLIFDDLITSYDKESKKLNDQWWLLNSKEITDAKSRLKNVNGHWQIPIEAKAGSLILWLSTTIHSARVQTIKHLKTEENPYNGWRGVVYVCYHPKIENPELIYQRYEAFIKNIGTNHWGKHETQKNLKDSYSINGVPVLTELGKSLACFPDL